MDWLSLFVGAAGGFLVHALTMKVSFKQRTIDSKVKVFSELNAHWIKTRNFVFDQKCHKPSFDISSWDNLYGESQGLIGEATLISDNNQLAEDINDFNERYLRTSWDEITLEEANSKMNSFKAEALPLIERMRSDIYNSSRIELKDFIHIFRGLVKND